MVDEVALIVTLNIDQINRANDNPLFRSLRQSMKALRRLDLNSLRSFAAVADSGGFTSAAERLDTTKARISLDVSRLEKQLGANLFTRTTRRVMLTDAGRTLYGECIPFLKKVESAAEQLGATQAQLKGSLRIT